MKKLMLITLLSIHSINISASELSPIDHNATRYLLIEDYKNYLKHQLEFYKQSTEKSLLYFDRLMAMSTTIIGKNYSHWIRDIHNDAGKTFLHIAVDKEDLTFIKQAFHHFSTMHADNKGKAPLDIAIEKLLPIAGSTRNSNQIVILETIAQRIADKAYILEEKENCLKKIIALELACKAHPRSSFSFVPNTTLLESLISNNKKDSENFLAKLYQEASEPATGNTFAHVFVQQENPDELFSLAVGNRISTIKNNEGLDPLHFALRAFREFTTAKEIDTTSEHFKKARCCYFILYHYFSKSSGNCCDKHKIPTDK